MPAQLTCCSAKLHVIYLFVKISCFSFAFFGYFVAKWDQRNVSHLSTTSQLNLDLSSTKIQLVKRTDFVKILLHVYVLRSKQAMCHFWATFIFQIGLSFQTNANVSEFGEWHFYLRCVCCTLNGPMPKLKIHWNLMLVKKCNDKM